MKDIFTKDGIVLWAAKIMFFVDKKKENMWSTWGCTINFSHQKLTLTFNEHDAPVHNWSSELTRYINEGATSMMHKFYNQQ